jgi:DNA-binding NarL/FixJ family response regulator
MPPRLRIFLAEDNALVRDGLSALINAQPDMLVIGAAADGESTCEKVPELGPDVVLMDVSLPRLDGAQATERLKKARPDVRVLALTFHGDKTYVRRLLDAGAAGYVLKRGTPDEIIQAIRIVARGGTYVDPEMSDTSVSRLVPDAAGADEPRPVDLSAQEEAVLVRLARGYTNKRISAELELSIKLVETSRVSALTKLGVSSRAEIVRYALQRGWI